MYNPDVYGFRNVTPTNGVATSTTPILLGNLAQGQSRSAIQVAAFTKDVYLKFVPKGSAVPTVTVNDCNYVVAAGDFSPFLGMSESIDVYAAAAGVGTLNYLEMGY